MFQPINQAQSILCGGAGGLLSYLNNSSFRVEDRIINNISGTTQKSANLETTSNNTFGVAGSLVRVSVPLSHFLRRDGTWDSAETQQNQAFIKNLIILCPNTKIDTFLI
jgi:hypothetical protein